MAVATNVSPPIAIRIVINGPSVSFTASISWLRGLLELEPERTDRRCDVAPRVDSRREVDVGAAVRHEVARAVSANASLNTNSPLAAVSSTTASRA